MNARVASADYDSLARLLHWLGALCVALAWLLGTVGEDLPKSAEAKALFVHISLGLAILALLVLRLGWRIARPVLPLATSLGVHAERAAVAMQWLLYALMLAVPLTGIVLQFARGQGLPLFGLAEIASPWPRNRALARSVKEMHELVANALMILALLHAGAALFHHYVLKDATLTRILRGRRP